MRSLIIALTILAAMWFVNAFPTAFAIMIAVATAYGFYRAFKWVWSL